MRILTLVRVLLTETGVALQRVAILLCILILAFTFFLITGCQSVSSEQKNAAGTASYKKLTVTEKSGKSTVTEEFQIVSPENDAKGSTFVFSPESNSISGSFGGQHKIDRKPEPKNRIGEWVFFGSSAILIFLGIGLISVGKHFKLGSLAFVGAAACTGIAVTIDQFAWVWAYVTGGGIVLLLAFVGYNLWSDWKNAPQEFQPI